MTAWVPVIDISRHQGAVDFRKMRAKGVRGLILRISHGLVLDSMAEAFYPAALAAGFDPADIGWYPFINPKRSSGGDAAEFAVEHIIRITGDDDFFYMIDVENYAPESPNIGQTPIFGAAFAAHIREHLTTVAQMAPIARRLGYGNRAYWNGKIRPLEKNSPEFVGDDQLAAELEWIVARYPAYSDEQYARFGYPGTPDQWDEWALKAQQQGPLPPRGASGWEGWQFSAGWNRQGATYGVTSRDLDLNFVHPEAWARWTRTVAVPPIPAPIPLPNPVPPQMEDDNMLRLLAPADSPARFYADCDVVGRARRCEWTGDGNLAEVQARIAFYRNAHPTNTVPFEMSLSVGNLINVSLDGPLPPGFNAEQFGNPDEIEARMTHGTIDTVARADAILANEAVARIGGAISDIRMGGQRIADAGGH